MDKGSGRRSQGAGRRVERKRSPHRGAVGGRASPPPLPPSFRDPKGAVVAGGCKGAPFPFPSPAPPPPQSQTEEHVGG
ncbi:MAG: hypothetical protein QXR87_07730 [Candidatus Hadarchaeales archaeon]